MPHSCSQREWLTVRADDQIHHRPNRVLQVRDVDLRPHISVVATVPDIADNADNLDVQRLAESNLQTPAQRCSVREELPHKRLVNYRHRLTRLRVLLRESSAVAHRYVHS